PLFVVTRTIFFHPLSHYPGPLLGRLSNLHAAYHAWRGDVHLDIARCHDKYGNFVRYGPNRLLVNTEQGMKDIYGHGKNVTKSSAYAALVHRVPNTFTVVSKKEHAWRRRVLSQGFSNAMIRVMETEILDYMKKLCQFMIEDDLAVVNGSWTSPKNMSDWCSYFSFDVMAKVIFGQVYNLLGDPLDRVFIDDIQKSNFRISVLYNDQNFRHLRLDKWLFPKSIIGREGFLRYIHRFMVGSEKTQGNDKSLFALLRDAHDPETGNKLSRTELRAETATLIAAGMDTTSTALASVFFYLCHYPEIKARLTAEIRETFPNADSIQLGNELNSCRFLTACIHECMRMSPSAGSSLWREVQVGGATIDNHFIPAKIDVGTGIYAIHHNQDIFPNPHEFDPDRWLRSGDATTAAFAPFSIGPRACVGKPLSMIELRLVTAFMLWNYDLKLASGALGAIGGGKTGMGPGRERLHEFQLFDHINAVSHGPLVMFRAREDKELDQGEES
ncbi:hypothetical protein D6D23_09503, partial [Aureobasidium pullulans]